MKFTVTACIVLLCGFAGGWIIRNPGNILHPQNDSPTVVKTVQTAHAGQQAKTE